MESGGVSRLERWRRLARRCVTAVRRVESVVQVRAFSGSVVFRGQIAAR